MAAKQSRTSSWTFCLVMCLLCLSCVAAKRPRKSAATHVAENKATLSQEATIAAKIQAKLQPGPDYRAESEEDEDSYGKGKGKYAPRGDNKYYDTDSDSFYGSDRSQDGYKAPSDYEQQYSRDNPKGPYAGYRDERDSHPRSREESQYGKEEPSTYGSYHERDHHAEYQRPSYQEQEYRQSGYKGADREQYQPRYDAPSKYHGPSDKQPYGVPRPGDNYNAGYNKPSYGRDEAPYGKDSYGKDSYGKDSYGKDSYGKDSYGKDSYGKDSYGEDSYGDDYSSYGPAKHHMCFQEYDRKETVTGTSTSYKSSFKCCTPADAPDACLAKYNYNDTRYDYYDGYKPYYETGDMDDGMFDSLITQSPPIECTWSHVAKMCPPHLMETCLGVGNMTCTLNAQAKDCGCPVRSLLFSAHGYFMQVDAMSCDAGVTMTDKDLSGSIVVGDPDQLFAGKAWFFKADIEVVHTMEGPMQTKAVVEYVVDFTPDTTPKAPDGRRRLLAEAEKPATAATPATPAPAAAAAKQPEAQAAPTTPQQPQQAAAAKAAEQPKQAAATEPKPATEQPKPAAAAQPAPAKPAEQPKPAAEQPAPAKPAEQPKAAAEQPKATTEQPKPAAEQPKAATEQPKPAAEQPKAATEPAPAKPTTPEQPQQAAAAEPLPAAKPLPAQQTLQLPLQAPVTQPATSRAAAQQPTVNSLLGLRGVQPRAGERVLAPKVDPRDGPPDAPIVREGNLQIIFYTNLEH